MKAVGSARLRRTDVVVRLEVVVERRLYFGVSIYSAAGTGRTYSGCCANGRCGYARRSGCSACSSGGRTSRGGGWASHRGWSTGCLAIEDIFCPSELVLVADWVRDGEGRFPLHCDTSLEEAHEYVSGQFPRSEDASQGLYLLKPPNLSLLKKRATVR